jgi:hypothetical protein
VPGKKIEVEASFTEVPNCFYKNAECFSGIYCGMKSSILKARQQIRTSGRSFQKNGPQELLSCLNSWKCKES